MILTFRSNVLLLFAFCVDSGTEPKRETDWGATRGDSGRLRGPAVFPEQLQIAPPPDHQRQGRQAGRPPQNHVRREKACRVRPPAARPPSTRPSSLQASFDPEIREDRPGGNGSPGSEADKAPSAMVPPLRIDFHPFLFQTMEKPPLEFFVHFSSPLLSHRHVFLNHSGRQSNRFSTRGRLVKSYRLVYFIQRENIYDKNEKFENPPSSPYGKGRLDTTTIRFVIVP